MAISESSGAIAVTADSQYITLLADLLALGEPIFTRNGHVKRLIGKQVSFAITPLVSIRRTAWRNALREWQWFMSGSSNMGDLHPSVRPWWQPWADSHGEIKNNYSHQFRHFAGDFDQVAALLDGVRNHPCSRRNLLTTWHAREMADPATPITNCHSTVIQAFVASDGRLDLLTYQRSVDVVCGLPHNWIQMWAFLLWLAHHAGHRAGSLIWVGGDIHLYAQHEELARKMCDTGAIPAVTAPQLLYTPSGEEFRADDFSLSADYAPILLDAAPMIV